MVTAWKSVGRHADASTASGLNAAPANRRRSLVITLVAHTNRRGLRALRNPTQSTAGVMMSAIGLRYAGLSYGDHRRASASFHADARSRSAGHGSTSRHGLN